MINVLNRRQGIKNVVGMPISPATLIADGNSDPMMDIVDEFEYSGGKVVVLDRDGSISEASDNIDRNDLAGLPHPLQAAELAIHVAEKQGVPVAAISSDPLHIVGGYISDLRRRYQSIRPQDDVSLTLGLHPEINGDHAAQPLFQKIQQWIDHANASYAQLIGEPDNAGDDFGLRVYGSLLTVVTLGDGNATRVEPGAELFKTTIQADNLVREHELDLARKAGNQPDFTPDNAS